MKQGARLQDLIDSPRSIEAFKRTGILVSELSIVDVATIEALLKEREKSVDIPKALLQLRVDAAEKNRRHKYQLIC